MTALSFSDMGAALREADLSALPAMNIAVLRNITVEPVKALLDYHAMTLGFRAEVRFGGFANILQDAMDLAAADVGENLDYVWVFLNLEVFSDRMGRMFATLSADEVEQECARMEDYIDSTLAALRRQTHAVILWPGFEMPVYPALGVADTHVAHGHGASVRRLNAHLAESLRQAGDAYFIDMDQCLAQVGMAKFYDNRYWFIGRAPYSRDGLMAVADRGVALIRSLRGKAKKCLVLDCDNVLWGGIVGEDGLDGIKIGTDYPGSIYREFQQAALNLRARGVILALCSKNNEGDVWRVFREHPEMVLKEEHVSAARINWIDKAENLRDLADDLNIGLDSLVFIDDSPFEVEMVQALVPEVTVIHADPAKATENRNLLSALNLFDSAELSDEDKNRGQMYRDEVKRKHLREETLDIGTFLESLEMEVAVETPTDLTLARMVQLVQRTNQFNLTTRRHTEEDLRRFWQTGEAEVLALRLKDKFGDYGIVGLAIVTIDGKSAEIDTLLMSCRALGRGVETVLLAASMQAAVRLGGETLTGVYVPTKKNAQTAAFYDTQGFEEHSSQGNETYFCARVSTTSVAIPNHFKSIEYPWSP